jgi:hypothetical protein
MGNVTVNTLQALKEKGEKFCCITAYDATFSRLISEAGPKQCWWVIPWAWSCKGTTALYR